LFGEFEIACRSLVATVQVVRARKKHVQQLLFKPHGGKRRGAGRPPKAFRSSERHKRRPAFRANQPIHVTLRVEDAIGNVRRRDCYHAIRRAMGSTGTRDDFRIVHISLERDHVHLIVEASDRVTLAKGMYVFEMVAAKLLNKVVTRETGRLRRGRVFCDRYHPVVITSPKQMRNTIAYVLNNWRRHKQDDGADSMFWDVDYFSSGATFTGWKERHGTPRPLPHGYQPLPVRSAQSWLLSTGWRKAGSISMYARPGPLAPHTRGVGGHGPTAARDAGREPSGL
jgi:REP element-mobilizing transposase RayT